MESVQLHSCLVGVRQGDLGALALLHETGFCCPILRKIMIVLLVELLKAVVDQNLI